MLIMLLSSTSIKGQDALESTFLTLSYNNNQVGSILKRPVGDMLSLDAPSFSIGFEKYLTADFNVSGSLSNGKIMSHGNSVCHMTGLYTSLKYKLNRSSSFYHSPLTPYISMGIGLNKFKGGNEMQNQLAFTYRPELGVDMGITDKLKLNLSVAYHANNQVKYRAYSVGLGFSITRKKDTDNDGIIDKLDRCPAEPGYAYNKGCPHPDIDKDGVIDAYDLCPLTPGSLNGCPDRDKDGSPDADDQCPDLNGTGNESGCPLVAATSSQPVEPSSSTKGDSKKVRGSERPALNIKDADEDKVADEFDACPSIKGNTINNGCPFYLTSLLEDSDLLFQPGKADLAKSVKEKLQAVMSPMNGAEFKIVLFAQGQKVPTKLAEERLEKVKRYLISQGISANRIGVSRAAQRIGMELEDAENRVLISIQTNNTSNN